MEIKDSGERTQFETGAVRDMHEGKGRCDLLPMCVLLRLARHYENGCKKQLGEGHSRPQLCRLRSAASLQVSGRTER